jgi:hypothetical protein
MTAPAQSPGEAWDEILMAAQCQEEFQGLYERFFAAADSTNAMRGVARQIENALARWRGVFPRRDDGRDFAYELKIEALRQVRGELVGI